MSALKQESYHHEGVSSTVLQVVTQGLAFVFSFRIAHCFGAIAPTDVVNHYCVETFAMIHAFMAALVPAAPFPSRCDGNARWNRI